MAGLEEAVLARRQKDLDKFTELYQNRLDKMTGKYIKDLAPAWDRMQRQLLKKVQLLYEEAGAINDPKKIKAFKNKAARLEALASQLAQDLKLFEAQQQPFYTGTLKRLYEDSYYFTAFGLEQAAKVGVEVPLLTPYHVLGVLANPWLPDGANYSDRIRANTAYLAKVMRNTIAQGVASGWGWNETARNIRAKAGESYYNAVRLARTEFTRAAAQGASYCYMNNADVLDGKRWNATKDSRTAPKDANNDGKLYDLDYDTVENPGVAGQRIPNHPHCRCLWSPVISALGVQNKERIARGKGDTPTSWGENYYTRAKTYREYAKKRGLPDLDDRLANDRPKSYLRPGETLADLNKKVTYWAYSGGAIAVAKPDWDDIKQQPKDTVTVQEDAAAIRQQVLKAFPVSRFNFDTELAEVFHKTMEKAPKEYREFAARHFEAGIDNVQQTKKGGSFYQSSKSGIFLDKGDWTNVRPGAEAKKARRARGTLIHEIGHGLDYGAQRNSLGKGKSTAISIQQGDDSKGFSAAVEEAQKLYKKMKKDASKDFSRIKKEKTLEKAIVTANKAQDWLYTLRKAMAEKFKSYGWDADGKLVSYPEYAGLSDIIDGITNADINSGYGHGKAYWRKHNGPQKEIFANLFELHVHGEKEAIDFLKNMFPDIVDAFNKIIKEV